MAFSLTGDLTRAEAINVGMQGLTTITNTLMANKANKQANKASATSYGQQAASYGQQAASYGRQAALLGQQMAMQLKAAGAYSGAARAAREAGKANAREARERASYIQKYEDLALASTNKKRRQIIGQGKVAFVANGVLLESRKDSAVAMWEQDEAADAAIEKLQIMQQAEDEAYGYLRTAQVRLAEGYSAAAGYYGQAAGAAAEAAGTAAEAAGAASNAVLSAYGQQQAIANKIAAEKAAKKKRGLGSVIGGVIGGALGSFVPGVGTALGVSVGASIGGAVESF